MGGALILRKRPGRAGKISTNRIDSPCGRQASLTIVSLINYLTLTIVLVSLINLANAANSEKRDKWQWHFGPAPSARQSGRSSLGVHLQAENHRLPFEPGGGGRVSRDVNERQHQQLYKPDYGRKLASSALGRHQEAPVLVQQQQQTAARRHLLPSASQLLHYELINQQQQQQQQPLQVSWSGGGGKERSAMDQEEEDSLVDANDDEFLRRLKVAGQRLDAKLAANKQANEAAARAVAAAASLATPLDLNLIDSFRYGLLGGEPSKYSQSLISDNDRRANEADLLAQLGDVNTNVNNNNNADNNNNNNNVHVDTEPAFYLDTPASGTSGARLIGPAGFGAFHMPNSLYHYSTAAAEAANAADINSNAYANNNNNDDADRLVATEPLALRAQTIDDGSEDIEYSPRLTDNTDVKNFLKNYLMLLDKGRVSDAGGTDNVVAVLPAESEATAAASASNQLHSAPEASKTIVSFDANRQQQQQHQHQQQEERAIKRDSDNTDQIKYTTLLEDETDDTETTGSGAIVNKGEANKSETSATTASYGKLILSESDKNLPAAGLSSGKQHVSVANQAASESPSIFRRMYNKLAHYIPFLGGKSNELSGNERSGNSNSSSSRKTPPIVATARVASRESDLVSTSTASQDDTKNRNIDLKAQQTAAPALIGANFKTNDKLDDNNNNDNNNISGGGGGDDVAAAADDDDAGNLQRLAKHSVSKSLEPVSGGGHEIRVQQSGTNQTEKSEHENDVNDDNKIVTIVDKSELASDSGATKDKLVSVKVNFSDNNNNNKENNNNNNNNNNKNDIKSDQLSRIDIELEDENENKNGNSNNNNNKEEENSFSLTGQFIDGKVSPTVAIERPAGGTRQDSRLKMSSSKRLSMSMDSNSNSNLDELQLDQMVPLTSGQHQHRPITTSGSVGGTGFNLIRDSRLMLPLVGASDESLLGKYIYAPTQHYYLNAVPSGRHHAAISSPNSMQIGSNQEQTVYGAYEPLRHAYAFEKDRSIVSSDLGGVSQHSSLGKSNDLYFLVMVGAFCVMAMAVVLAAGLFAYRVQQQRKTCQETEYPTYGVVGPNNLSGKCGGGGAAAFVGGYFGPPGPLGAHGLSGLGSKSGSAKHLADLYAHNNINSNNNNNCDSGINSIGGDKLSRSATTISSASGSSSLNKRSSTASNNGHGASDHQQVRGAATAGHDRNSGAASSSNNNNNSSSNGNGNNFMLANQDAARMYHYQHQKQQMLSSDRSSAGRHTSASDMDSEDDNDDGSYTVYECPGLASAHEMEIKNPLFNDDHSP